MGKSTHTTRTPRVSREALEAARNNLIDLAVAYILANNPADLTPFRVWDVIDAHGRSGNAFYASLPESGRGSRAKQLLQDVTDEVRGELRIKELIARTILILLQYTLDPLPERGATLQIMLWEAARRYDLPKVSERNERYQAIVQAVREGYERQAAAIRSEIVQPLTPAQRAFIQGVAGSYWGWVQVDSTFPRETADTLAALGLIQWENGVTLTLSNYGRYAVAGLTESAI